MAAACHLDGCSSKETENAWKLVGRTEVGEEMLQAQYRNERQLKYSRGVLERRTEAGECCKVSVFDAPEPFLRPVDHYRTVQRDSHFTVDPHDVGGIIW